MWVLQAKGPFVQGKISEKMSSPKASDTMEVVLDETSMMSADVESRLSEAEVEVPFQGRGAPPGSVYGSRSGRLYMLVRSCLESGQWDSVLPRYEKNLLIQATFSLKTWSNFLEASSVPPAVSSSSSSLLTSNTSSSTAWGRKSVTSSSSKVTKPSTRSKRGASTPRRRGADSETHDTPTTDQIPSDGSHSTRELIETLQTRVRTLLFDTLIDEVLFHSEKHLNRLSVKSFINEAFGVPDEPLVLDPFFTLEDLKEAHEASQDNLEKEAVPEYMIPLMVENQGVGMQNGSMSFPATPSTPKDDVGTKTPVKSKRKLPANRELRNLMTGSKGTRKWERLDLIGASDDFKSFIGELEKLVQALKDNKANAGPFLKPVKDSEAPNYKAMVQTPMDLSTISKKLDNLLYWNKNDFSRDVLLIFENCRAYNTEEGAAEVVEQANELEKVAKSLLQQIHDAEFAPERERLADHLHQVIPDVYDPGGVLIESSNSNNGAIDTKINSEDKFFDSVADALKRVLFFREDPSFSKWKRIVQERIEKGPTISPESEMEVKSENEDLTSRRRRKTSEPSSNVAQNNDNVDKENEQEDKEGLKKATDEMEVENENLSNSEIETSKNGAGASESEPTPIAKIATSYTNGPDPLFELPKPEYLPFQWFSAIPNVYSSLAPFWPLSNPLPPYTAHVVPDIAPICSANQLIKSITHRNNVLMARVKAKTNVLGHAPLDPTVVSSPAAHASRVNGKSLAAPPEVKIEGSQPITKENSGFKSPQKGAKVSASKLPSKTTPSKTTPSKAPSTTSSTPVPSKTIPETDTNAMETEPKVKIEDSMSVDVVQTTSEAPVNMSETFEAPNGELLQGIPPIFSPENSTKDVPILNELQTTSTEEMTMLDAMAVHDLMKQSVAIQLAMAGYESAQESCLNVLTDVLGGLIGRLGFTANTYISAPGTTLNMVEIMDRTMSEVYPRGIESVKTFITAEVLKSDNCLRTCDTSLVRTWIHLSPSLSNAFNNPQPPAPTPSGPFDNGNAVKLETIEEITPIEGLMTKLKSEEDLDALATSTADSREYYLQHAPFSKKTNSYLEYRPQAFVGSLSNVPVGTPGGLHLLLPPTTHHLQPQKQPHPHMPHHGGPPGQHGVPPGQHGVPGQHPSAIGQHPQHPSSVGQHPSSVGQHPSTMSHMNVGGPQQHPGMQQMAPPQQGSNTTTVNLSPLPGQSGGGPPHMGHPNATPNRYPPNMMANNPNVSPRGPPPNMGGIPASNMAVTPGGAKKMMPSTPGRPGMPYMGNTNNMGGALNMNNTNNMGNNMNTGNPMGNNSGTMAMGTPQQQQHPMQQANYMASGNPAQRSPYNPNNQYLGMQGQGATTGMPGGGGNVSMSPGGTKKVGGPPPGINNQAKPGRPRLPGTPGTPGSMDDGSEASPRATAAKRKRPPGMGGVTEEDDGTGEESGRRTRSRRGVPAPNYTDEYYYHDEEDFDDGMEGEPKRKRRKTPAKSTKRH